VIGPFFYAIAADITAADGGCGALPLHTAKRQVPMLNEKLHIPNFF
jgi:hypothetical protein